MTAKKSSSFPIEEKLVIAVSSGAIFDLGEADRVFREEGEEAYRQFTRMHEMEPFLPGSAFDFVKRICAVNDASLGFVPIEVVLLSRNDADTGNRVLMSADHYKLPVTRAAFICGQQPHQYIDAFNASLFLSANPEDVKEALAHQKPAGLLLAPHKTGINSSVSTERDPEEPLKIAFDFDGIIADAESEDVFQKEGMDSFHHYEVLKKHIPHRTGPLFPLLKKISEIQKSEFAKQKEFPFYKSRIRTAIITARSAPAQQRVVHTLRSLDIHIDEAFFLGGISKARILDEFKPHIFFDDQVHNLLSPKVPMALVHVPAI